MGHQSEVIVVNYSPNGKYLASSSKDGGIIIWDQNSGESIRTYMGQKRGVRSVNYSPNGKHLAFSRRDGAIRLIHIGELLKIY